MKLEKTINLFIAALLSFYAGTSLGSTYENVMDLERWWSDANEKFVQVGKFNLAYNEKGEGEPVLFVHGFGADKDVWNRVISKIDKPMRLIAIDLPGSGKSGFIGGESYTAEIQAQRIDDFRKALGIDSWHIVGWSMGGTISGTYAGLFPERVKSLTLVSSGGFRLPTFVEGSDDPVAAAKKLVVRNRDDLDQVTRHAFYEEPWIPWFVKDSLANDLSKQADNFSQILPEVIRDITSLKGSFQKVKAPLQVIWGRQDRMMNVVVVDSIKSFRPDAETQIFEDCGHTPPIERVSESASLIENFVAKHSVADQQPVAH